MTLIPTLTYINNNLLSTTYPSGQQNVGIDTTFKASKLTLTYRGAIGIKTAFLEVSEKNAKIYLVSRAFFNPPYFSSAYRTRNIIYSVDLLSLDIQLISAEKRIYNSVPTPTDAPPAVFTAIPADMEHFSFTSLNAHTTLISNSFVSNGYDYKTSALPKFYGGISWKPGIIGSYNTTDDELLSICSGLFFTKTVGNYVVGITNDVATASNYFKYQGNYYSHDGSSIYSLTESSGAYTSATYAGSLPAITSGNSFYFASPVGTVFTSAQWRLHANYTTISYESFNSSFLIGDNYITQFTSFLGGACSGIVKIDIITKQATLLYKFIKTGATTQIFTDDLSNFRDVDTPTKIFFITNNGNSVAAKLYSLDLVTYVTTLLYTFPNTDMFIHQGQHLGNLSFVFIQSSVNSNTTRENLLRLDILDTTKTTKAPLRQISRNDTTRAINASSIQKSIRQHSTAQG